MESCSRGPLTIPTSRQTAQTDQQGPITVRCLSEVPNQPISVLESRIQHDHIRLKFLGGPPSSRPAMCDSNFTSPVPEYQSQRSDIGILIIRQQYSWL
jgi:hypothetical protein